ncbi:MAG: hypothetical protein ACK40S_00250 [Burkholderiaceae bacterium]
MHTPLRIAQYSAAIAVLVAGAAGVMLHGQPWAQTHTAERLLLAPMIGVLEPCILTGFPEGNRNAPEDLETLCAGPDGSAAALVESTLQAIDDRISPPRFPVGYTLAVPLLHLFRQEAGHWVIDTTVRDRFLRTVQHTDRPVVLYLFSTHFSTTSPLEKLLAADPRNLAETAQGPMGPDQYYGAPIHHWSVARMDNDITLRREQAVDALMAGICALPPKDRRKIRAVTILGETHHFFPQFETGMGFARPYRMSDYSRASLEGFRHFLRKRFGEVAALNQALGSSFAAFDDVPAPSRDIRSETLSHVFEHLDGFAGGVLPVSGWMHAPDEPVVTLQLWRNGALEATTHNHLNRQDVLEAKPELGHALTGWRWDLDVRHWPRGQHRLDIYAKTRQGLHHLGTRHVTYMERDQQPVLPQPVRPLPAALPPPAHWSFAWDHPAEALDVFYNPLVPLWHAFREEQVRDYLQHFAQRARQACPSLAAPMSTHQIFPYANPSWDAHKFAVGASLDRSSGLALGVSLYGEAAYGSSFKRWWAASAHRSYGVTEFHPLKPLTAKELHAVLAAHERQGARFVSFFLEPRWQGRLLERGHNPFSFDPDNTAHASDVLYRSTQQLLQGRPNP